MNFPSIKDNPIFYLGILIVLEQAVGHGTVSLTNVVPASWVPYVTSWCNLLAFFGTTIMTALAAPGRVPAAVAKVVAWLAVGGLTLAMLAGPALAQGTSRKAAPVPVAAPVQQGSGELQTLGTYTQGRPFVLRLLNPLGLPDPLCITDHPSGACAQTTPGSTGGVKMTGDPNKDLAGFLQHGGIVLIRDMMRADQYLSYPCKTDNSATFASGSSGTCNKTELGGSSCLEAIIPVAKMVVNGPPSVSASTTSTTATTPATSPAQPATPAAADSAPTPATAPVRNSTDDPAIDKLDEGVITSLAKQAIIFDALQSPQLQQGCGGFILQKFKDAATLGAGIMQFITTLGLAGA